MRPASTSTRHSATSGRSSGTARGPNSCSRCRTCTARPGSSSLASPCVEDPARLLDVLLEPAAVLVPRPGEVVGDAPAAGTLAVEPEVCEDVEQVRDRARVAKQAGRLQLALADEGFRVDDEPRLALGAEDVPAVEVLVHEMGRRPV